MRKPDVEVREVVCSETGKPMPKIPLWMADIKVKFVSDEARQKHPTPIGAPDLDLPTRSLVGDGETESTVEIDAAEAIDEADFGELEPDVDSDEAVEEDF